MISQELSCRNWCMPADERCGPCAELSHSVKCVSSQIDSIRLSVTHTVKPQVRTLGECLVNNSHGQRRFRVKRRSSMAVRIMNWIHKHPRNATIKLANNSIYPILLENPHTELIGRCWSSTVELTVWLTQKRSKLDKHRRITRSPRLTDSKAGRFTNFDFSKPDGRARSLEGVWSTREDHNAKKFSGFCPSSKHCSKNCTNRSIVALRSKLSKSLNGIQWRLPKVQNLICTVWVPRENYQNFDDSKSLCL